MPVDSRGEPVEPFTYSQLPAAPRPANAVACSPSWQTFRRTSVGPAEAGRHESRIVSLDVMRGLVMVLMAVEHLPRDGNPAAPMVRRHGATS